MKKNILKFTGISVLFLMISLTGYAQERKDHDARKIQKEQIASAKKDFIKKELNLTAEEEKAFWPLYDQMNNEIKVEKVKKMKLAKEIRLKNEELSEAEFKIKGEELYKIDQAILDIKRSYFNKMGAVISYKNVLKLYEVEKRFKKELLKKLKSNHQKPAPSPQKQN